MYWRYYLAVTPQARRTFTVADRVKANFLEPLAGELRRILVPRTRVNKLG